MSRLVQGNATFIGQARELLQKTTLDQLIMFAAEGSDVTIGWSIKPGSEALWATALRNTANQIEQGNTSEISH